MKTFLLVAIAFLAGTEAAKLKTKDEIDDILCGGWGCDEDCWCDSDFFAQVGSQRINLAQAKAQIKAKVTKK